MTVLVLERVPAGLRGELTRWFLEVRTGVFVGKVSALVRDKLWDLISANAGTGGAVLIHPADNEQGFAFRLHGTPSRRVVDFEGLALVRVP